MNIKKIEEVIRLMERHGLTEISIDEEGARIHLKKGPEGHIEKTLTAPSSVLTPAEDKGPGPAKDETKNLVEIKAPMVGTFYSSPAPDAKPFVDIGSAVKSGDVICIIEAMKLMNEIKSEVKGKIVDVLVENAEPIEFGQVLFLVEPS
jgi:acetyl-CoA carboxylase biotin carboxyl carrier protein